MNNTITEDAYRKLKKEVENARTESERAKGALEQLLKTLRTEFECNDLKEAKAALEELKAKRDRAHKKLEQALKEYEDKWEPEDE
jgi:hypothetical protein